MKQKGTSLDLLPQTFERGIEACTRKRHAGGLATQKSPRASPPHERDFSLCESSRASSSSTLAGEGEESRNMTFLKSYENEDSKAASERALEAALDDSGERTEHEEAMAEMRASRDPDHPPPRYVEGIALGAGLGLEEAKRRWRGTQVWRAENQVDSILGQEAPQFVPIRRHYSHFFHGRGPTGSVALYIRPGHSTFSDMWRETVPVTQSHISLQAALAEIDEAKQRSKVESKKAAKEARKSRQKKKRNGNSQQPQKSAELVAAAPGGGIGGGGVQVGQMRKIVPEDLVRHHIFMLESLFSRYGPEVKGKTGERTTKQMQQLIAVSQMYNVNVVDKT